MADYALSCTMPEVLYLCNEAFSVLTFATRYDVVAIICEQMF